MVLDTNVFVAAGFKPRSSSAVIIDAVRQGRLRLVWDAATRRETETVIRRIPPLDWGRFSGLFEATGEYRGVVDQRSFERIADPEDRKFAALAAATGSILISSDAHFLSCRDELPITVFTPREFLDRIAFEPT